MRRNSQSVACVTDYYSATFASTLNGRGVRVPARSRFQRKAAAIAKHHSEQLYPRNRGLLSMNLSDLAHYASTPEQGLPKHVKKKKRRRG